MGGDILYPGGDILYLGGDIIYLCGEKEKAIQIDASVSLRVPESSYL